MTESSCGACVGECGIGESAVTFGEPGEGLSNKKPVNLGKSLDCGPVHYNLKKGQGINYDLIGPLEREYKSSNYGGRGLYLSDIRPSRNPGLYNQSSFYVRGFSEVSGEPDVADRPYVNFFRHNLDSPN